MMQSVCFLEAKRVRFRLRIDLAPSCFDMKHKLSSLLIIFSERLSFHFVKCCALYWFFSNEGVILLLIRYFEVKNCCLTLIVWSAALAWASNCLQNSVFLLSRGVVFASDSSLLEKPSQFICVDIPPYLLSAHYDSQRLLVIFIGKRRGDDFYVFYRRNRYVPPTYAVLILDSFFLFFFTVVCIGVDSQFTETIIIYKMRSFA